MRVLPFILSIPHCGLDIPAPLRPDLALDHDQILESIDFGTREIFGDMPALERNYLDKHASVNRTAWALTENGLSFIAAHHLHK